MIVAAEDMPPSVFLATDWREGGLVLRRGSPSSHVAIMARSRGVPMMVGIDIDRLEGGADAVLDGDAGILIVDPDPVAVLDFMRECCAYSLSIRDCRVYEWEVSKDLWGR